MLKRFQLISSHDHSHGTDPVEADTTDTKTLIGLGVALLVGLVVLWYVGEELLYFASDKLQAEDLAARDQLTIQTRTQEEATMSEYDVQDAEKQLYRIPIQNAMEMVVKRNSAEPIQRP